MRVAHLLAVIDEAVNRALGNDSNDAEQSQHNDKSSKNRLLDGALHRHGIPIVLPKIGGIEAKSPRTGYREGPWLTFRPNKAVSAQAARRKTASTASSKPSSFAPGM